MKILYISPENTVGTLSLWRQEHISRGNTCRTVTFFRSPKNFEEDICLDLPFNFTKPILSSFRNIIYQTYRGHDGYFKEKSGFPPQWEPEQNRSQKRQGVASLFPFASQEYQRVA